MAGFSRRPQRQRGAAMVEFALVLVPLLLILCGTIDWGYYFFVREIVTNAAREGARTGAIDGNGEVTAANTYLTRAGLRALATSCSGAGYACVTVNYPTGSLTGFLASPTLIPQFATATARMRLE